MAVRERIERYRTTGAAAGLIRVEVLVPPEGREEVLALASRLRKVHRDARPRSRDVRARDVNAEAVNDRAKLLIHRLVARRLAADPSEIPAAMKRLAPAPGDRYGHVDDWRRLLVASATVEALRGKLVERSPEMARLRSSSPFGSTLDLTEVPVRRRIWRKARAGLQARG